MGTDRHGRQDCHPLAQREHQWDAERHEISYGDKRWSSTHVGREDIAVVMPSDCCHKYRLTVHANKTRKGGGGELYTKQLKKEC